MLFNSEYKRKIVNRMKKIPKSHFDFHLNKGSFKTDFILFKNEMFKAISVDTRFWSKKAFVFLQAGEEHRMQFAFSITGLLCVLNTRIATWSHLRLFTALLEMLEMNNSCLPLESSPSKRC